MNTALPIHPTLVHPLTGKPLQAVGIVGGRVIWPTLGASEPVVPAAPGAPAVPAAPAAPVVPAASVVPPVVPAAPGVPAAPDGKVEDLPDWAQKIITDVRKEAGDARAAGKTAAETAQAELTKSIGKALGLIKDDEPGDPVKLTEQLTASQSAAKDALVQLNVYKAAGAHQADPNALLDSNSFLAKVRELDHTAKDFEAKLGEAIKKAVTENPKLKGGLAPTASGIPGTGGPGPAADIDAAIDTATKAGDHATAIRLKRQKAYAPRA